MIDGLGVALNFTESGVDGDGGDLVRCAASLGEAPCCGFAQAMEDGDLLLKLANAGLG